jgi:hypothetical protein
MPDPDFAERLDELNPFAVEARYGMGGEELLMREEVGRWLDALWAWALAQVHGDAC